MGGLWRCYGGGDAVHDPLEPLHIPTPGDQKPIPEEMPAPDPAEQPIDAFD